MELCENNWCVYLLKSFNGNRTYIGASNNPDKRLKCHNGEISGGAKSTKTDRPWKHICIMRNLKKINALQLEWRLKRWKCKKSRKLTNCPGKVNRIHNIFTVLNLDNWTTKSPLSKNINIYLDIYDDYDIFNNKINELPSNITYNFINK